MSKKNIAFVIFDIKAPKKPVNNLALVAKTISGFRKKEKIKT